MHSIKLIHWNNIIVFRFSHTPPQTPHFSTTLGHAASSTANTSGVNAGRRSEEQLAFLSPPPAYDQLTQQQQQQLQHYQQQQQHQHIYGTQAHHTGTLPHSHHHMQPQMAHHPSAIGHYVVSIAQLDTLNPNLHQTLALLPRQI